MIMGKIAIDCLKEFEKQKKSGVQGIKHRT